MKPHHSLIPVLLLLFSFSSIAQRQLTVRALDITQQTSLHDFTVWIIHEKDTASMVVSAEHPPLTIGSGEYELMIQKEGYRIASTDRWECKDDTATVIVEFRLLKVDATRREIRRGHRHSRKMGIDTSLSPVESGGFQKIRPGMGRHFTSIVYVITKDSFDTHWVIE